jgi:hypothetical protein
MFVQAAPGTKCPKEGKPREYICREPVEMPDSAYYRRLVTDGSLIVVKSSGPQKDTGENVNQVTAADIPEAEILSPEPKT